MRSNFWPTEVSRQEISAAGRCMKPWAEDMTKALVQLENMLIIYSVASRQHDAAERFLGGFYTELWTPYR
jgi:hypothetical protein